MLKLDIQPLLLSFFDFHDTKVSPRKMQKHIVDFLVSRQAAQSESRINKGTKLVAKFLAHGLISNTGVGGEQLLNVFHTTLKRID